jgi:plasmid stability protein
MARITIRDLPDHIHQVITEAAVQHHRSTEGEIRFALQQYAITLRSQPAKPQETASQIWQKETGQRLAQLFDCLRRDEFFTHKERHDVPHLARTIGEEAPAHLLDCLEGNAAPSFEMLDRIAAWSSCCNSWLISGAATMFPVENIGSRYHDFFLYDRNNKDITFHLLRICGGRSEGTILCIRHDNAKGSFASGFISEHFKLKEGMGSGGHGNLNRFIRFLKTQCGNRAMKASNYEETMTTTNLGTHHPLYYMRSTQGADWLMKLFQGEDPANWLKGSTTLWKDMSTLPFGNCEIENDGAR